MSSQSLPNAVPNHPLQREGSTNTVPFPTPETETPPVIPESASSSSNITSSDKLSALPGFQSSPTVGRTYQNLRATSRRSLDETSLPAIRSSPGPISHAKTPTSRYSESEGSAQGRDTPKQRVSFESERGGLPAALRNLRQAVSSKNSNRQESGAGSPSIRSAETSQAGTRQRQSSNTSPIASPKDGAATPASRSPTPSRAASPRRLFGINLHRAHSRDEPFIPNDPYKLQFRFFASPSSTPPRQAIHLVDIDCDEACSCCLPLPVICGSGSKMRNCGSGLRSFFMDTFPRQAYLHILLRLPSFYFSRVARIFEDAEVSKHEVQRMIAACAPAQHDDTRVTDAAASLGMSLGAAVSGTPTAVPGFRAGNSVFPFPSDWDPPSVSPALSRFKHNWEAFVDALIREWKTLNLVSVLVCTALLTLFQVADAAGDPLTRWAALFSLICSLMSLSYGCIYIVQFGTMRSMYKASRWAEEAQKTKTFIWWNVWVLLSMPAVWLSWSMLSFFLAILSYIWRTGSSADPADGVRPPLSPVEALAIRTVLTVLFGVGIIFFVMILRTFASYGTREVGWRRSWLNNGRFGRAEVTRERERQRQAQDRERGRGRAREAVPEVASPLSGLGLTGMSTGNVASMSAIQLQEADSAKAEKREDIYMVEMEKLGRKISPKL